jgi:endonuclease/exonuclease/phosphatase (EEP) superfamily protein YafD
VCWIKLAVPLACLALISSCASQKVAPRVDASNHGTATADVAACQQVLPASDKPSIQELDARGIRLLNWNAQKNRRETWQDELESLSVEQDLVLVQEASLRRDSVAAIDSSRYWSFAPGYRRHGAVSGVLTMSRSKPIAQCALISIEPILRTPKATSITEYGLTLTEATLIVVNIHAVNFSIGLGAFQEQFDKVRQVLETHDGPIVLSGDFNTWRKGRTEIVDGVAQGLGLTSLAFPVDHRVTRFGNYLDHIYVRGLSLLDSGTEIAGSSDHNPMFVTLSL